VEVAAPTPDNHKHILCCLIDSGSSDSIVWDEFIVGLKKQQNTTKQQWSTKGGVFSTDARCAVPFYIVDFATNKRVDWTFHVDSQSKLSSAGYNMTVGRDLFF
jgi:hypothetical protein